MDELNEKNMLLDDEAETAALDFDQDIQQDVQEDAQEAEPEPALPEAAGARDSKSMANRPGELEWMYFQSFGKRALLTREEEVALGKRIEHGDRTVRRVIQKVRGVLKAHRENEQLAVVLTDLKAVLSVSGLSATELEKGSRAIRLALQELSGWSRRPATKIKELNEALKDYQRGWIELDRAKTEMVLSNLRLVVDCAKHYSGRGLSLLDLIQEGNIGLMKAAERFDHRRGFKFSTYATWWIRQGITRALADQSRTIRIPVHMTEAYQRVHKATRQLAQRLGRQPSVGEVAEAVQTTSERVGQTMQAFQEVASLEHPIGDGEALLGDLIPDRDSPSADSQVDRNQLTHQVSRALGALSPREEAVIRLRFGIGQGEPMTLEEVGRTLGVTRERIRQIEAKALMKLRTPDFQEILKPLL